MDDLNDKTKKVKAYSRLIELLGNEGRWEWTGEYIQIKSHDQGEKRGPQQYVLAVPAVLIYPLAPSITRVSDLGDQDNNITMTWRLSIQELQNATESLWSSLCPESSNILENMLQIPKITYEEVELPYQDWNGKYLHFLSLKVTLRLCFNR